MDYKGREEWSFELYVNSLGMARGWFWSTLLLHLRSIDMGGAQEKEGHFHFKNFLRASK